MIEVNCTPPLSNTGLSHPQASTRQWMLLYINWICLPLWLNRLAKSKSRRECLFNKTYGKVFFWNIWLKFYWKILSCFGYPCASASPKFIQREKWRLITANRTQITHSTGQGPIWFFRMMGELSKSKSLIFQKITNTDKGKANTMIISTQTSLKEFGKGNGYVPPCLNVTPFPGLIGESCPYLFFKLIDFHYNSFIHLESEKSDKWQHIISSLRRKWSK